MEKQKECDMVLSRNTYSLIEEIVIAPGTVEAGDVMMVGDHFFIGISGRTNNEGADQMIKILKNHGLTRIKSPVE